MARIRDLDPATYARHVLHTRERCWAETNCYTDVVIELLHGLGFEPLAALPFTLAIDFDVDQWTFFKFPHADVEELFALAMLEMAPWKPLVVHVHDHVAAGRPVLVELDSFFLPDTQGTAYGIAHVKSTVAVNAIDLAAGTMEYFHNQGYFALDGQDFRDVFQTDGLVHERMLPPYIEFVKPLPRQAPLEGSALVEASRALVDKHVTRLPPHNPFRVYREQLAADMDELLEGGLDRFHEYSFVTLRQLGACYELAAAGQGWLDEQGVYDLGSARAELDGIAATAKLLQMKLARSVMRKRALDLAPLDEMAERWERAMASLGA